jgi:hypothetical protein
MLRRARDGVCGARAMELRDGSSSSSLIVVIARRASVNARRRRVDASDAIDRRRRVALVDDERALRRRSIESNRIDKIIHHVDARDVQTTRRARGRDRGRRG